MGSSTTDGNMDASASDLSSTDAGTEEPAPPVVSSRFLRALNFFSGQKTVTEIPPASNPGPAPVVVIRDTEEEAIDEISSPGDEGSNHGFPWRQGLMAMDGIELPEFEDLDSLPATGWDEDGSGVILSPLDASWDAGESRPPAHELSSLSDPRQLWLNTDEAASAAKSNNDNFARSESQDIMSTEGMKPYSETAAIPPLQKTKLWTGLGQPGKQPSTASEADSVVIATDKEWSDQSADVAFVAAILDDVPAPETDLSAVLEESEVETEAVSGRGAVVKLAPGWKPVRGETDGGIGASGGDDEVLNRVDTPKGAEAEEEATVDGESEETSEAVSKAIVRAPRHDSIVEGFGNFLSDSVVLDAAFTEPAFKALNPDQTAAVSADSEMELAAETAKEAEEATELVTAEVEDSDEFEIEAKESGIAADVEEDLVDEEVEVTSEASDADAAAPLSLSLDVVAPDELNQDDVVPAAIVAPPLIDAEGDAYEAELSELGRAGFSMLGTVDGEVEATPLLDKLADEETDDSELKDGEEMDRFGSLADFDEPASSAFDGGFTSGNSALVRHGVRCPACEQTLRIQNRYVGIEGRCPGCAEMIVAKRMGAGLVLAELAEVEAPKFLQQPDIEPGDVWGGTRLAAGGGLAEDPEEDTSEEVLAKSEPEEQVEAETESSVVEEEAMVMEDAAPPESDGGRAGTEEDATNDSSPAAPEPMADPFSNPSRLSVGQSNEADGVWGGGIGKSIL